MQFVEREPWIGAFNAWYHLGVDGISMPLIVLTAFITPLVVIAGWTVIEKRPAQYLASFLILEGLRIGVRRTVLSGLEARVRADEDHRPVRVARDRPPRLAPDRVKPGGDVAERGDERSVR